MQGVEEKLSCGGRGKNREDILPVKPWNRESDREETRTATGFAVQRGSGIR